jgi:AraC-like DNA-binding protein
MYSTLVHTLDWALRAGVIALMLFLGALLLRDRAAYLRARITAAFSIGTAAYVLYFGPGFATPGALWQLPILVLSAGNMVMFWLFASVLFDDEFRVRPWHVAAWATVAAVAVANCLTAGNAPRIAQTIGFALDMAGLVFALLAFSQAIVSWRDDLVEARRRLRLFMVVGGSVYAVLATWSRFGTRPGTGDEWASLADIAGLAVIPLAGAWHILQVAPRGLIGDPAPAPAETPVPPPPVSKPASPISDPAEDVLIARLKAEMSEERAYRRENLTIGALASQLGLQEYRLRRLINQRLGYRNFNAFLNHFRLEDAKRMLADPARADVAVLTIAIDVGFQSIGPFNRAFKAVTGLTPTEFRRLGRHAPVESAPRLADSEIGQ